MKKAYQHIALVALALSFAACSQEDDFTPQGNQKDAPITIASAGVAELTTRAAITSQNGTDYLTGGSIGVFVTSTSGGRYEGSNIKWTYNDGWGLDDATVVLFENNGEKQQIAAYYPYNENLGTGNVYSITLPEAYDENYEDFDYLYGASAPLTSNPATIGLNHLMTKVTVVVQSKGTDLVDNGDEVASIALVGVPRTADWTVPSATLEKYGDSENITLYRNGASHYGYALPNGANDLTLYITTESGRVFTATTSLDDEKTADTIEKLTSGMHYTIGVIVGRDKVKINSVSVEPWGDGGALEGGVAEEILDATGLSANELNAAVTKALEAGDTDLTITLAPDASAEMFTAIRRALIDTDGVADGSINLTLGGVTSIPDHSEFAIDGSIIFGRVMQDENGEDMDEPESVLELNSINLPDVLTIGKSAFSGCENLTSVTAPKVQTIGQQALGYTALTSVEFPELTTIPTWMFDGTSTLTSAKFPKVTIIEDGGLLIGAGFAPEAFLLELTAEGDITFNGNSHFNAESQNYSGKIDLVLHSNKSGEVNGLTWKGYTFKSIEFLCTDGTTNHTYGAAVNNSDGTHTYTCTTCNLTKIESCHGEATCKELATCEACGVQFGELSDHILDPTTGYCKFGCGTFVATFTIEAAGNTTYYKDMGSFENQELADGSVVTLLAEETSFGWGVRGDYTLDLNGYDLTTETYSIYAGVSSEITEVGIVNSTDERSSVPYIRVNNCTLKIGGKVDVAKMILFFTTCTVDLTNADFSSCELNLNLDGCNTSQFVLGNYAIYNASNNVVTGELTKGVTYTIKAAQ